MVSDDDILEDISIDFRSADLSKEDFEMLKYAQKVTEDLLRVTKADVERLKEVGFSDTDIFDINQVVAYFNYVNRIADGLGVELEK